MHEIPSDLTTLPEPYPILNAIREDGPVQRVLLRGREIWLVTGYDEVMSGLTHPALSNNARFFADLPGQSDELGDNLLNSSLLVTDPPDHTRLRRSVSDVFTARRIASLRPRIQRITDALLDALAPVGHADLMAEFAIPLPITVIGELLGIPDAEREAFRCWSIALVMPPADAPTLARAAVAQAELARYFTGLIARKRAEPGDDLLTALAAASGDDSLSDRELQAMAILLVLAGHETTANLIGTGTLMLLRNPDQLAAVRDDPALLPGAVEELARYAGPISLGVARFTHGDVELGGQHIPAGQMVMFALAAASRDPSRYDHPDELDVTRRQRPHLAFGHGIHYCLGAPLARTEAVIALGSLLRRLPNLALAIPAEHLTWRAASTRGLAELPVSFALRRDVDRSTPA
jgi:cytochrome P450